MIRGLALALAVLMVLPTISVAQRLSNMIAQSGLSPEDFQRMTDAGQSLYVAQPPRDGAQARWSNADTGSRGTVTLRDVADNCLTLVHSVHPQGAEAAREIRNRRCRSASGEWLNATN